MDSYVYDDDGLRPSANLRRRRERTSWPSVFSFLSLLTSTAVLGILAGALMGVQPFDKLLASRVGQQKPTNLVVLKSDAQAVPPTAQTSDALPKEESAVVSALATKFNDKSATIARINALYAFNSLLAQKAKSGGVYPVSGGRYVPAKAALRLLDSKEFVANVPADALEGLKYYSDGKSFKVIALGTGDCAVVRALRPNLVDPSRSAGAVDCIAYGFWTPNGAEY